MPGSHDWSSAVSADSTGNIFVAGQTNGLLFAAEAGTGQDIWVTKLDGSNGELLWGYQASFSVQSGVFFISLELSHFYTLWRFIVVGFLGSTGVKLGKYAACFSRRRPIAGGVLISSGLVDSSAGRAGLSA